MCSFTLFFFPSLFPTFLVAEGCIIHEVWLSMVQRAWRGWWDLSDCTLKKKKKFFINLSFNIHGTFPLPKRFFIIIRLRTIHWNVLWGTPDGSYILLWKANFGTFIFKCAADKGIFLLQIPCFAATATKKTKDHDPHVHKRQIDIYAGVPRCVCAKESVSV